MYGMASSARFDERSLGPWSTPQAGGKARDGALTPALLAVAAGAVPFKPTGETIDTIATRLASARAAGCLHDTFEALHLVWKHGGRNSIVSLIQAFFAGLVSTTIVDLIADAPSRLLQGRLAHEAAPHRHR